MPDIDSLSIRLSSSSTDATTAIQRVIDKLTLLNAALNNYTDDSKFVKGMGSLTGGLSGIAKSINSIDLEKMKDLATVLNRLSGAGTKISQLNFAKPFADMGANLQHVNSAASQTAAKISEIYMMPSKYKSSIDEYVKTLYGSSGKPSQFREAEEDLKRLVNAAQKSKREFSEVYNNVNGYLNAHKTYIPESVKQDWGDSFSAKRGVLGVENTTTQLGSGDSIEHVVRQLNELYGAGLKAEGSITEMADSLVNFLEEERRAATQVTDFTELDNIIKSISAGFQQATAAVTSFNGAMKSSDDEMLEDHGSTDFDDIRNEAMQASVSVTNLDAAVEALKAQMTMEIQNPFEGLITGLESLKAVELPAEKFAGISQLANSIGKFGGKNSDKAVTNIPRFTKAFADMAAQLSQAPQISDNLVRLAEAMSKFSTKTSTATKTTTKFGSASKVLSQAFRGMYPHTMRAHHGFTSLAAIFGRLYANFFLLIRGARALGRAMNYSSSMTEAQNVVAVTFGKSSNVMDDFAKTAIKDFGMARLSATEFASRFQAMGSTMGITAEKVGKANAFIEERTAKNSRAYKELGTSVADMSINLTKLTADMASLYNQDYADVAQDMQAIYTGMTRPLRKYGLDLTQATLKEWALANGLDADIEKMSQAEKTMLRYQYVMTRASGAMGDFQKTADTWANAMRTVKQLLQEVARTIGEALINALRPALLAFRNFLFNFLELTQSALNALGKLLGWKQINFASATLVDDTEDYADALDDAAGAAKKLKGQLRGIDELNNLTTNDKGGGSGSGLSGLAASIDDLINNADEGESPYKSAIKSWYEFGTKISYAIRDGLANIDWTTIYGKASTFAHNLAEFLNGIIRPDTFAELGKTIAGGIMTALEFAFEFGDTFDWVKLGNSISEGIGAFFKEFDGGKLADTIDVFVQGLWKALKTAITQFFGDEEKRKSLFEDIGNLIFSLDKKTIEILEGAGVLVLGTAAITGAIAAEVMKNPIAIPLVGVTIGAAYLVGKSIGDLIVENETNGKGIVLSILFGGVSQLDMEEITSNWKKNDKSVWQSIASVLFGDIGQIDKDKIEGFFTFTSFLTAMLDESIKEFRREKKENMQKLKDKVKELYIDPWIEAFQYWTSNPDILSDLGFSDWLDNATKDLIENAPEILKELVEEFKEWSGFDEFDSIGEMIFKGIIQGMISFSDGGIDVKFLFDAIKDAICSIFGIESPAKEMYDVGENIVLGILKGFDLVDFAGAMSEWWENNVAPWFTLEKWNELLQPIRLAFKYAFQAGANFAIGALNKVLEGLENMMNGAGDLFNALIELASKIVKKDLEKWGRITLPRIATPYANGGYPQVGSLFLAGEAGSEMVGTINGRTGVVSNGEITGIADAIRSTSDTEIQLLRQQNTLLQGILNKEFGISSDSIFNSVRSSARDFTNRTGDPAFI